MNYRKKPVVIEAFQMTKERRADNSEWPEWLHRAWNATWPTPGAVSCEDFPNSNGNDRLVIATLEGTHTVSWGDWIIRGVHGELYPCKPDIFALTYEPESAPGATPAPAAVPDGDTQARIAGLEASIAHLSRMVDEQRALLVEVNEVCGRDGHGGELEDGESEVIDKVRAHLDMLAAPTPSQTATPAPAAVPLTKEQVKEATWDLMSSDFSDPYEYDLAVCRAIEKAHGIAAVPGKGE